MFVKILPVLYGCTLYMEFKSVRIFEKSFFPLIDRAFYLVFDLTVHKLYLIYVIFVQLKESILCNLNLFEFFQYYVTVQDII